MRSIARRLIASEATLNAPVAEGGSARFRAVHRLAPHLSMLMGKGGFQALLARSVILAGAEIPWLLGLRVSELDDAETLTMLRSQRSDIDLVEGEAVLLAHLLGLLAAFIGPALTRRVIHQIWPQLSFDDADFSTTAHDEKAK
jgi:hypothetical protein